MIRAKHQSAFWVMLLVSSSIGCSSMPTRESAGTYYDDSVITSKVKLAVFRESSLKSAEIHVTTSDGVVRLSGSVRSQANIDKAVELARSVPGVKSVKNDMTPK